jgi:two-component system, OmpR family, KDP operon response regulator KdpE
MTKLTMIVEDDPATRKRPGGISSHRGRDVRSAPTADEALALPEEGLEPDFLILDLGLPDGDGETVFGAVRGAGLATRVIVCTGMVDPMRLLRLGRMRPDVTLIKPIDADVIARLCESWEA